MEHFDTLQKELSKTLEQIGHVFAAPNDKTLTAAAAKLKYTLPRAQGNFQDALDRLSDQIEHAQLVLRRDLAIQTEAPKPPATAALAIPDPAPASPPAAATEAPVPPAGEETKEGPAPELSAEPEGPTAPAQDTDIDMTTTQNDTVADQPPATQPNAEQPSSDSQALDSTDNDNISALLPGLQDYANNQPESSGDADFDDIFGTVDLGDGDGAGEQGGTGMEGMDSFLDFDFGADFGDGGVGDGSNGIGDGDGNGNVNIDDEVDFFKFD